MAHLNHNRLQSVNPIVAPFWTRCVNADRAGLGEECIFPEVHSRIAAGFSLARSLKMRRLLWPSPPLELPEMPWLISPIPRMAGGRLWADSSHEPWQAGTVYRQ